MRKTIFITIGIVCALGIGIIAYVWVRSSTSLTPVVTTKDISTELKQSVEAQKKWQQAVDNTKSTDADLDGLTDSEETKLGTDPHKLDTDGDGLSDYAEVNVYKSNPLKASTRGDGTTDGWKVKHRLDPVTGGPLK